MKICKFLIYPILIFITACATIDKAAVMLGEKTGNNNLVKMGSEMTPRQEYYLGRSVSAQIFSRHPLHKDKVLNNYVNIMGQYLALHSSRPETYKGYRFAVVSGNTPAAMSAPGGFIFITKKMLEQAKSEDEVAAILAHEIAHVAAKHAEDIIRKQKRLGVIRDVASFAGRFMGNAESAQAVKMFGGAISGALDITFNKGQEIDADKEAVDILYKAGYHPAGLLTFISRMKKSAGFFSRHPTNSSRIDQLRELIRDRKPAHSDIEKRATRFARMQAR